MVGEDADAELTYEEGDDDALVIFNGEDETSNALLTFNVEGDDDARSRWTDNAVAHPPHLRTKQGAPHQPMNALQSASPPPPCQSTRNRCVSFHKVFHNVKMVARQCLRPERSSYDRNATARRYGIEIYRKEAQLTVT
jgi:hypothetical protein